MPYMALKYGHGMSRLQVAEVSCLRNTIGV